MLDYFCIFTKGGTLLWALSFVGGSLKGDPINTLIRNCLLEERAAQSSFEYLPPAGGAYTLKWSLNNVRSSVGGAGGANGCSAACLGGSTAVAKLAAPAGHTANHQAQPHAAAAASSVDRWLNPPHALLLQGLGLVFVAVYQKALKLLYVDELLERANKAFSPHYRPGCYAYPEFDAGFQVGAGLF